MTNAHIILAYKEEDESCGEEEYEYTDSDSDCEGKYCSTKSLHSGPLLVHI